MVQICITFNGVGHADVTITGPAPLPPPYPKQQSGCDTFQLSPGNYAVSIVGNSGAAGTDIDITGIQLPEVHDNVPPGPLQSVYFITV